MIAAGHGTAIGAKVGGAIGGVGGLVVGDFQAFGDRTLKEETQQFMAEAGASVR